MDKYIESKKALGRHAVRPPNLNFSKKKETSDYIEYSVKTNKDTKEQKEGSVFENSLDSFIYCTPEISLKMPKEKFMKRKNGSNKYAYVCLMFPAPKTKMASYTDGCILAALGLRRQGVQADIVCLVTPDISKEVRSRLEVVYDKVLEVPYITPFRMTKKDILINKDILKNCHNYNKLHPYSHVFTKLHIFNPDILPYEKVVFVDSDLVPMNFYDSLFTLNTPAGWVEYRKKFPFIESWNWDRCDSLVHGKPIPKFITDIDKKTGADVNAGLMVISPDKREYNAMIKELQSPVNLWFGEEHEHKGFWDMDFGNPQGRKFVKKSYCYPEQNYLTKRFSGKWTFVSWSFQSWSLDPCNSFGLHMAAFNPKPWFKQPVGLAVKISDYYQYMENTEGMEMEKVPLIIDEHDNFMIYENITYAYEMFNEVMLYGMINFRELHKFFIENLKIYGAKISFGADNFKQLSVKYNVDFMYLKDIKPGSQFFYKLSRSQKYLSKLINDYDKYINKIKDKDLNICKNIRVIDLPKDEYDLRIVKYSPKTKKSSKKLTKNKRSK